MEGESRAGDLERFELESELRMQTHPVQAESVPLGLLMAVVERVNAIPKPPSRDPAWWEDAAATALKTIGSGAAPVLWEFLRQQMLLSLELRRITVEDAKSNATIARGRREIQWELEYLKTKRQLDVAREGGKDGIREFAVGVPAGVPEGAAAGASEGSAAGVSVRDETQAGAAAKGNDVGGVARFPDGKAVLRPDGGKAAGAEDPSAKRR